MLFRDNVGAQIYDDNAMDGLQKMIGEFTDNFIDVCVMPVELIKDDMPLLTLLRRLVKPTAWQHVERQAREVGDEFWGSEFDQGRGNAMVSQLSHNVARERLVQLAEAIRMPPVTLPGASHVDKPDAQMPWRDAQKVIDLELRMRGVMVVMMCCRRRCSRASWWSRWACCASSWASWRPMCGTCGELHRGAVAVANIGVHRRRLVQNSCCLDSSVPEVLAPTLCKQNW